MTFLPSFLQMFRQRRILAVWGVLLLMVTCLAPRMSRGQASSSEAEDSKPPVDPKLQLIGSLASSHIYTTFGYIGVVADNTQKELYSPERVDDLMREVTVISSSLVQQLEELQQTKLTDADAEAVKEIIGIYKLLDQEADALRAYAKAKNEANGNSFYKIRTDAWIRVARLVGIPAESPPNK